MDRITQVPTNIITGALGVGKTTLIQALLSHKPKAERWAVLVNEFGEVGVDGALLSDPENSGIFIREVPGGCMCCTSGLPMQIALNMLLARAKPHRLLIEPTGLGHPKEVLQTLSGEHYQEALDVRATLTLIDVRKLTDKRWREHNTFQEQLQVADHIIATKCDLYDDTLMPELHNYLDELGIVDTPISHAQNGQIDPKILFAKSRYKQQTDLHHHAHSALSNVESNMGKSIVAPAGGSVKVANSGEGYYSFGWVCSQAKIFDYQNVMQTLSALSVERLKAVLITEQGVVGCNLSDGCLSLNMNGLEQAADSRLEFLTQDKVLAQQTCKMLETAFDLHP
jgi:G3E family GTPase